MKKRCCRVPYASTIDKACQTVAKKAWQAYFSAPAALPLPAFSPAPLRFGTPYPRPLLRSLAHASASFHSFFPSPATPLRFPPPAPGSLPPSSYLLGPLPAGLPPTPLRSPDPPHARLCAPDVSDHLSSS